MFGFGIGGEGGDVNKPPTRPVRKEQTAPSRQNLFVRRLGKLIHIDDLFTFL